MLINYNKNADKCCTYNNPLTTLEDSNDQNLYQN